MPITDLPTLYCPMGCGNTLHVMSAGLIRCLARNCPDPGAVGKILSEPETWDVVSFSGSHFNVLHPLRERIGGALLECPVAEALTRISGPPNAGDGKYYAWLDERERLVLKRVPDETGDLYITEEIPFPPLTRPAHVWPHPDHRCVQGVCNDHAGPG